MAWRGSQAMLRSVRRCVIVLVALAAACADEDAARLGKIKDAVCACETTACTDQELAKVPQDVIKSTHRTQTLAREMMDCIADVQSAAPLVELKTKLCACTTADCVEQAQADAPPIEGARSSKLTRRVIDEMRACAEKLTPPGTAGPASAKTP